MEFRVLGTIEVDGPVSGPYPPGAKERAILARLLVDAGRTVPADTALEALDGALALWRGDPFGDLADADWAQPEIRRLEDLRQQAEEGRARALVALGRPLEAVPLLRRLIADDPLREELVATLMRALYAAGRQVEALDAYRRLAGRLRELGL